VLFRSVSAGRLAAVISPHLTVEEAYLLAKYIRGIDAGAVLSIGPVPVLGQDETFKNGFTIRAEKAPNRRGVEEIVKHFGGHVKFDDFLAVLDQGEIRAAWVTGGYPTAWHDVDLTQRFAPLDVLIVQDMFDSPLWHQATYQVPGGSFAERDGSYVNHADRLQRARWAVRPPAGAWVEGALYWRLLQRPGMFNSRKVLDEIAAEIPYFAVAADEVPETGVDLKINQLAGAPS
jgi:NADH-quinone oxidoreductase subunit G